ncbi:MAG TPA: hypothetical protein PKE30_02965 [Niabella sp.]|nr:hypothetical protein [Niabella sp.]
MNQIHETMYMLYEKDNKILKAKYKPGIYVDYEIAKQIVEDRISFTGNENLAVLIYDEGITNITREARMYLASKQANRHIRAGAIINKSPVTSVLGNFFIIVNKPSVPCKLFRNEAKAIKWLTEHFI